MNSPKPGPNEPTGVDLPSFSDYRPDSCSWIAWSPISTHALHTRAQAEGEGSKIGGGRSFCTRAPRHHGTYTHRHIHSTRSWAIDHIGAACSLHFVRPTTVATSASAHSSRTTKMPPPRRTPVLARTHHVCVEYRPSSFAKIWGFSQNSTPTQLFLVLLQSYLVRGFKILVEAG